MNKEQIKKELYKDRIQLKELGKTYERIMIITVHNQLYIADYTDGIIDVQGNELNYSIIKKWCKVKDYLQSIETEQESEEIKIGQDQCKLNSCFYPKVEIHNCMGCQYYKSMF